MDEDHTEQAQETFDRICSRFINILMRNSAIAEYFSCKIVFELFVHFFKS